MATNQRPWTVSAALTISALAGVALVAGCSGTGTSAAPPSATARPAGSPPSATATAPATPPATPPPAALSPAALYQAALAALRSGVPVHIDMTNATSSTSVVFSDDASATGGRQIITYDKVGHATILLIAGIDYVQGNAQALEGFFQLSPDLATQVAGKWIELQPGEKLGMSTYDDVTAGITLSSVADTELTLSGTLTAAKPATISGQLVSGVQSPMPASDDFPASARNVLYVTDNSLHRPVTLEVQGVHGYEYQMSFSQWGEQVPLTAPTNTIPASEITPVTTID
jgi:hypothetical protein